MRNIRSDVDVIFMIGIYNHVVLFGICNLNHLLSVCRMDISLTSETV